MSFDDLNRMIEHHNMSMQSRPPEVVNIRDVEMAKQYDKALRKATKNSLYSLSTNLLDQDSKLKQRGFPDSDRLLTILDFLNTVKYVHGPECEEWVG